MMAVTVVYAPASRVVREVILSVPVGCSAAQAVELSGLLQEMTPEQVAAAELGVWGHKVALRHVLRAQDRLEIYRPLKVDPKVARRERFVRQGAKSAGLFAKRRAGAKAGY